MSLIGGQKVGDCVCAQGIRRNKTRHLDAKSTNDEWDYPLVRWQWTVAIILQKTLLPAAHGRIHFA